MQAQKSRWRGACPLRDDARNYATPTGVWVGWRLHQRLDQVRLYRACYGLLVITALKLLWDGVSGYLR